MARDRKSKAWNVFKILARFNRKDIASFSSKENFCRNLSLNESHCEHTKRVRNRFIILQLLEIFRKRYLRRTIVIFALAKKEKVGVACFIVGGV
jgi:hypothetical protein